MDVGARLAMAGVGGLDEGARGVEDFVYFLHTELDEVVAVGGGYVVDVVVAELQDGVVVVGAGVLDEEKGGGNGERVLRRKRGLWGLRQRRSTADGLVLSDDAGVKEGL